MTALAARAIAIYAKTHGEAEAYAKLTDWDRAVLQAIEEAFAATTGKANSASLRSQSEFHTFRPMRIGEAAREYRPSPTAVTDAPPIVTPFTSGRVECLGTLTVGSGGTQEPEE